jgi:hypothetical protein
MTVTVVLLGLAVGTYALKSAAPLLLGGRALPRLARLSDLLPAALLAALVVVSAFTVQRALTVDSRAAGVLVAAAALTRRVPFVVVVLLAAAATAMVRAISG